MFWWCESCFPNCAQVCIWKGDLVYGSSQIWFVAHMCITVLNCRSKTLLLTNYLIKLFICVVTHFPDKPDWYTASIENVYLIYAQLQQKWTPVVFRTFTVHSQQKVPFCDDALETKPKYKSEESKYILPSSPALWLLNNGGEGEQLLLWCKCTVHGLELKNRHKPKGCVYNKHISMCVCVCVCVFVYYMNVDLFNKKFCILNRDVTVWKFLITIIVTKIITVISIITVLLKCAGDVQKVPTHKSLQVL